MTESDRDLTARVAARLDPFAFNPSIPWPTPSLLKVRRRIRFRALRAAIEVIRMVRSPPPPSLRDGPPPALRERGQC